MMHGIMQLVLVFIFCIPCLCFILFNIYFPKYTTDVESLDDPVVGEHIIFVCTFRYSNE